MTTLFIILAIIILFALLRFGVSAEYSEEGLTAKASVGPVSFRLFPRKEKPDKKERKPRKEKKDRKKPTIKPPGGIRGFLDIIDAVKTAMSRCRRRILIKRLIIRYVAAGDDAYKTAMSYGAANAAIGAVVPILENNFRIRRRDITASADFLAAKPGIYANAAFSLALWESAYIGFAVLPVLLRMLKPNNRKDVEKNGQAPNQ